MPRHLSQVKTLDHKPPMTQAEFDAYVFGTHTLYTTHYNTKYYRIVHSVKQAIAEGIHPKMITKGSSGSYFARAKVDGRIMTVA